MQEEKADDVYYLKYQLSWLGKEYDERRWVSYARQRDEITAFLDRYLTNEDGMLDEEQNVFAEKTFELFVSAVRDSKRSQKNRSALKRSGHAPGKTYSTNVLKKLDCHISSRQNQKCRMENANSDGMLKDFLIL